MDNIHSSVMFHSWKNITYLPAFLCEFCPSSAWCILLSIHCDLSERENKRVRLIWNKGWVAFLCWGFKLDIRWRCCQIWRWTLLREESLSACRCPSFQPALRSKTHLLRILITASWLNRVWTLCCFFPHSQPSSLCVKSRLLIVCSCGPNYRSPRQQKLALVT